MSLLQCFALFGSLIATLITWGLIIARHTRDVPDNLGMVAMGSVLIFGYCVVDVIWSKKSKVRAESPCAEFFRKCDDPTRTVIMKLELLWWTCVTIGVMIAVLIVWSDFPEPILRRMYRAHHLIPRYMFTSVLWAVASVASVMHIGDAIIKSLARERLPVWREYWSVRWRSKSNINIRVVSIVMLVSIVAAFGFSFSYLWTTDTGVGIRSSVLDSGSYYQWNQIRSIHENHEWGRNRKSYVAREFYRYSIDFSDNAQWRSDRSQNVIFYNNWHKIELAVEYIANHSGKDIIYKDRTPKEL